MNPGHSGGTGRENPREESMCVIDSGSISNYLSAPCQTTLELDVKLEEGFERLTLVDGSKMCAQGYVQFALHCGN